MNTTEPKSDGAVRILYRNYKGETAWRIVTPEIIFYASNQWHPQPQWLMNATDVEKGELRTFALKDVIQWGDQPQERESIEQMVREILTAAQKDRYLMGLLRTMINPLTYTAGDVIAPANILNDCLRKREVRKNPTPQIPPPQQVRLDALKGAPLKWAAHQSFVYDKVTFKKSAPCEGGTSFQFLDIYEEDVPTLLVALKQQFPKQFVAEEVPKLCP